MFIFDTKEQLLTDFNKLYQVNPPIQLKDVQFVEAGVWLQNECNARVTITAAPTSDNFKGSSVVYYNRFRMDEELRDVRLPGTPGTYKNTYEVLTMLREVYGIPAYPEDFPNNAISATATTVSLTPRLTALAWQPPYAAVLQFDPQ